MIKRFYKKYINYIVILLFTCLMLKNCQSCNRKNELEWNKITYSTKIDSLNNEINDLSSLSEYSYVTPILDGNNIVNLESKFTRIEFEEAQKGSTIKFNLLIPLYDIVNISTKEYRDIDSTGVIDLNIQENDVVKNVPYGVWIADNPVEIINDININFICFCKFYFYK